MSNKHFSHLNERDKQMNNASLENIALYERLIAATDLPDVIDVLRRLQAASRDHHLPAFQRCAEQGSAPQGGQGFGRGKGRGSGRGRGFGRGGRASRS